ncbi:arylsulfatase B-like [Macrosteles quadrilineatus]|uniref:arylsulfatase B-like n=1 Tax=Macrosteles quadrilineatus TaxID=74068 RepID=UPI0023E0C014|nr:arylsulfatase B-like [Macrosteles quadrilineatus]
MSPVVLRFCVYLYSVWLIRRSNAANNPHIVFIMADDMGWNDVSFHGSDQIPTPNIDSLGYNGVILNRHYVQPTCTPTRASLMTGRHPIHTGQHWPYYSTQKSALPLTEKILPEYLKELGYATHVVGKWHLGFYKREFTPLQRGFDSHLGYWGGSQSYYDHVHEEQTLVGYDMRRDDTVAWELSGQYATDLFSREAVRLIKEHPPNVPMFLLLNHLAVHAGNAGKLLEAPQEVVDRFRYIPDPNRRTYAAMMSKLDDSVGEVVEALGEKDMLRNSIVVFLSDNGAPNLGHFNNWGSNYPWRGHKATLWEGGVRTPSVVWSPLIANPSRVSEELMHVTDWLPTLLRAAGYQKPLTYIDGVDQWLSICYDLPSPRTSLLLDLYDTNNMRSIIMGHYKYIYGATSYLQYNDDAADHSSYLNHDSITSRNIPSYDVTQVTTSKTWVQTKKLRKYRLPSSQVIKLRKKATISCERKDTSPLNCDDTPCIFDLAEDACEQENIFWKYPILGVFMGAVLDNYKLDAIPDDMIFFDLDSDPEKFNGTWDNWVT